MKQRIIGGALVGAITISAILLGGAYFNIVVGFICLWGSYEFCSSRNHKVNIIELIIMASFVSLLNFFFTKALGLILLLIVALICLAIFDSRVPFDEICIDFVESLILGFSTHYLIEIENESIWFLGYIVIAAYLTDLFAYFIGNKYGRTKLNKRISPNKSLEGAIGGWACGAFVSLLYATILNFFNLDSGFIIICSLILPIMSQIGDLSFSLIKRHFNTKDFSKLIPGHGGLLDRLDSLFFVLIVYGGLSILIR